MTIRKGNTAWLENRKGEKVVLQAGCYIGLFSEDLLFMDKDGERLTFVQEKHGRCWNTHHIGNDIDPLWFLTMLAAAFGFEHEVVDEGDRPGDYASPEWGSDMTFIILRAR